MKFSNKLYLLRKKFGYNQEKLAEICGVSRQSVSKWESGVAFPETEKLIVLSDLFNCSIDVLIKDENDIQAVLITHKCGQNAINNIKLKLYEGIVIKESLNDDSVIDYLSINKVELWNAGGTPKYWTALYFTSDKFDLPEIFSRVLKDNKSGNWFVDFKCRNIKYIVFYNSILSYTIGNQEEKQSVCDECRKMGIIDSEMQWSE